MSCWRPIGMSLCAPNRNVSVNLVVVVRWECVKSPFLGDELGPSIVFRNSLVPARNAGPIATATTKCDLMRSAPSKETKPS